MYKHTITSLAGVACCALAAAGCGSTNDSSSSKASASTSASATTPATPAAPLAGTYVRKVTQADIARTKKIRDEAGPNQETPKPSRATMSVTADGLAFTSTGAPRIALDYSATPDGQLEIRGYQAPQVGAFCGPDIPQNATYQWKKSATGVALRAVDDKCADRDSTLTGTWTKK
jgi:hypothetical protein